jgi:pyroglutamyl-peptidase
MRVVVTGFGSFPRVEVNPSARLVECLPLDLPPLLGHDVRVQVLPVTYRACADWIEQAGRAQALDILLHVGVRASGGGFALERFARNACRPDLVDAQGVCWQDSSIDPDGPQALASTLPVEQLCQMLAAEGLAVAASTDAGAYLCNYLLYKSLQQLRLRGADTWAGFLHIPRMAGLDPAHPNQGQAGHVHVRVLSLLLGQVIQLRQKLQTAISNRAMPTPL